MYWLYVKELNILTKAKYLDFWLLLVILVFIINEVSKRGIISERI